MIAQKLAMSAGTRREAREWTWVELEELAREMGVDRAEMLDRCMNHAFHSHQSGMPGEFVIVAEFKVAGADPHQLMVTRAGSGGHFGSFHLRSMSASTDALLREAKRIYVAQGLAEEVLQLQHS